jgi:biopolymer transport protein ExbD
MAEIASGGGGHEKKGKPKKLSTRVDFTPMVDLAFLLITFFMLATSMIKPQTMEIAMPSNKKVSEEEQSKVKASKAVTIILGKNNKVFYYEGTRENDIDPTVHATDFSASGLRKLLVQKNVSIMRKVIALRADLQQEKITQEEYEKKKQEIIEDKQAPVVVIKATEESSYRDLIDVLDEMAICNIGKYAIVDITPFDLELLKTQNLNN